MAPPSSKRRKIPGSSPSHSTAAAHGDVPQADNSAAHAITTSAGKARTALEFKLPSKALDDAIAAGGAGMRLLALKDITPLQGGL
jgi:uncharacterized protein GlcG (DUF336 family)